MSCTHPNYTHEARSQARVQTQPPCWGGPRKSGISPNSSADGGKKNHKPASELGSVRFTPPLCHTSICGFHLCRLSDLSDIYRLHLPRCASPAVVWRTKDARHRRKGLIVNMIIPSDAVISFVSEWHARAHPHRNIWDLFWVFFLFWWKGQKQFAVLKFALLRICPIFMLILEEIICNFISSAVMQQHQENAETWWINGLAIFILFCFVDFCFLCV